MRGAVAPLTDKIEIKIMIKVRCETPETIPLIELKDFIYYKQEKTFSEHEYAKCLSLQRAVCTGAVIVLERREEKNSNFIAPAVGSTGGTDISVLFDYLKNLESKIDQLKTSDGSTVLVDQLTQKIDALEKKLQGPVPQDNSGISETAKKLEEILVKFSGISSKSDVEKKELVSEVPEEIYVPNIRVEDGNSHINLKIRTIEKSDDINSASEALKKLRKNNS
jgi:hypothetical protein